MDRAAFFALIATSSLVAGAAQAQQICCVAQPPPQQVCCVSAQAQAQAQAGLRGYADPAYAQPQAGYAQPAYAQPQPAYGSQYAPPQYASRPPPADGLRGFVGVEYGKARLEPGTPSPRVETWTGEAAVSGEMRGLGVQGDIKVASYNTLGSNNDGTITSPTVHVYQRTAYGLIGGWAGWSHSNGANLYGIGAEGQAYLGSATLYGSLGYGHTNATIDQNLWAARLQGRYFLMENFALDAQAGFVRASASGAHTTVRTVGFGAEYQPDILPFSILANYDHADASGSSAASDTIRLGLRWNFDGGTLQERDRLGPTLSNVTDQFESN